MSHPGLAARLAEKARLAPLPFPEFMEACLYDPGGGYYASSRARIGAGGDFVTSTRAGPLFGQLLAGAMAAWWRALGAPAPFAVVEQGAGDGWLMADVARWVAAFDADFAAAARFGIVEPFGPLADAQRATLARVAPEAAVAWSRDLPASPFGAGVGVLFGNELLDAFPVERIRFRSGAWRRMGAAWTEHHGFQWAECGPLDAETARLAAVYGVPRVEGFETELHPATEHWARDACAALRMGVVLVMDYGYEAAEYYRPERNRGTLRAYRGQVVREDVLAEPGEQDITAHVNFSILARAATASGAALAGFTDQHRFLTALAADALRGMGDLDGTRAVEARAFSGAWRTLAHPGWFGGAFKVAAVARGFPANQPLAGFTAPGRPNAGA